MAFVRSAFAASIAFLAASAAQAQQEPVSPYSLGLAVGRAPIGLNASVVGRAQFSAFSAFGKLGTTNTRPDTTQMGMSAGTPQTEAASGLSWGGGVSWDFSPRLSASVEWASYDLRMPTGPVRTTNLGLQFKY
jgi:hypothetical protein